MSCICGVELPTPLNSDSCIFHYKSSGTKHTICCSENCISLLISRLMETGNIPTCFVCNGWTFDELKYAVQLNVDSNDVKKQVDYKNLYLCCSEACKEKCTNYYTSAQKGTLCALCYKPNCDLQCSKCLNIRYCSRQCQVANWKKHKIECQSNADSKI